MLFRFKQAKVFFFINPYGGLKARRTPIISWPFYCSDDPATEEGIWLRRWTSVMEQTGEVNPFLLAPRGSEPLFCGQRGKWTPFSVGTGQRWKWTPLLWSWAVRGSEPLFCGHGQWGEVNPSSVGSEGKWTPLLWAVRGSESLLCGQRGSEPLSCRQWGQVNPSTRSGARMRPSSQMSREGRKWTVDNLFWWWRPGYHGHFCICIIFCYLSPFFKILNKKWEVIERLTGLEGIIRREARRQHGEEI